MNDLEIKKNNNCNCILGFANNNLVFWNDCYKTPDEAGRIIPDNIEIIFKYCPLCGEKYVN